MRCVVNSEEQRCDTIILEVHPRPLAGAASVGDGRQQAVLLTVRPSDAVPLKTAMERVLPAIGGLHSCRLASGI